MGNIQLLLLTITFYNDKIRIDKMKGVINFEKNIIDIFLVVFTSFK